VVEDNEDLRRMFRTALTLAGYDAHEAGDGYAALQHIDRDPPTAIVLDLGLPHVNGHVVLQELMGQVHTRDIPVIIVTAQSEAEPPAGAACLLRKPVTPDRLVSVVRHCIRAGGGSEVQR